jgi:lysozyme family protein
MADFNAAYLVVRAHEGGYANNPNDRGGETYKGISRKNFPGWSGWVYMDDVKNKVGLREDAINTEAAKTDILQKLVRAFFKDNFWNELSLDQVNNQDIAVELFDTGVNMGTGVAATFLQRVLNATNRNGADFKDIKVDGRVGPGTVGTLNQHKRPRQVLVLLNCLQGTRYIDICEHNPSQEIFMNSWTDRVAI